MVVATHSKYENVVLGAWGCGAFGNDPKLIAFLFKFVLYCNKDNPVYTSKLYVFAILCFAQLF